MSVEPPSARATVRRLPKRGNYEREQIEAVLDEGIICHLGVVVDGAPLVLPTTYARIGSTLYVHGAPANHLLGRLADGAEACVTVTLVDGLVLARSAFHHSINYRSVVVFGAARKVLEVEEKRAAMDALVEHIVPGRTGQTRAPSDSELRATLILALPIDEASAKLRSGPPVDDEEDMGLPVWAGVVPLAMVAGAPEPDPQLAPSMAVPDHAAHYRRP